LALRAGKPLSVIRDGELQPLTGIPITAGSIHLN
jgi:hypothetical protein